MANIRNHGERLPCRVSGDTITFNQPVLIAPEQSVVIYNKDVVMGGGIVV